MCTCQSQTPNLSLPQHFLSGNHKFRKNIWFLWNKKYWDLSSQFVCGLCWLHCLFGWLLRMFLKATDFLLFPTFKSWFSETLKWWSFSVFLRSSDRINYRTLKSVTFWTSDLEIMCMYECIWKNNGAGLGNLYYKNKVFIIQPWISYYLLLRFPLKTQERKHPHAFCPSDWSTKMNGGGTRGVREYRRKTW